MAVPSGSVQVAENINRKLERLMPVLFPFGIVLGFTLPGVFGHLRPMVPWLFGVMTLSGALRLRVTEFGDTIRSPLPILLFMVAIRVAMPLLAMFSATFFFGGNPDTVTGFVLLFSGPVAVSSFIWVGMFNGNKALCLTLILLDTLLAPIVVPGTLSILMGENVTMDMGAIAVALVFMVVIPTVVGVAVNETSRGKIPALACPYLAPAAKICLMLVIAANSSAIAGSVRFGDPMVWKVAALCVPLSVGGFMLARLAGIAARCSPEKNIAMFFSGGLKNISVVTTIAVTFFPESVALPTVMGILFQQSVAALMAKLVKCAKVRG
ncbi:MAG: hypothetical protein FWD88_00055 [Treponema sp.]|nr:hypothetical protein [Treponema sp.]